MYCSRLPSMISCVHESGTILLFIVDFNLVVRAYASKRCDKLTSLTRCRYLSRHVIYLYYFLSYIHSCKTCDHSFAKVLFRTLASAGVLSIVYYARDRLEARVTRVLNSYDSPRFVDCRQLSAKPVRPKMLGDVGNSFC